MKKEQLIKNVDAFEKFKFDNLSLIIGGTPPVVTDGEEEDELEEEEEEEISWWSIFTSTLPSTGG